MVLTLEVSQKNKGKPTFLALKLILGIFKMVFDLK